MTGFDTVCGADGVRDVKRGESLVMAARSELRSTSQSQIRIHPTKINLSFEINIILISIGTAYLQLVFIGNFAMRNKSAIMNGFQ